jgi:PHD/YefM family antitoxin component YafN of YafNO toxin-antitoxin module
MIQLKNIRSLSDFQRNTKSAIKRLRKTGQPEVLTVNGKASLVVQDAESYQKLFDDADLADSLQHIRQAIRQAERDEGRPMREALEEMAARKGIRLKP